MYLKIINPLINPSQSKELFSRKQFSFPDSNFEMKACTLDNKSLCTKNLTRSDLQKENIKSVSMNYFKTSKKLIIRILKKDINAASRNEEFKETLPNYTKIEIKDLQAQPTKTELHKKEIRCEFSNISNIKKKEVNLEKEDSLISYNKSENLDISNKIQMKAVNKNSSSLNVIEPNPAKETVFREMNADGQNAVSSSDQSPFQEEFFPCVESSKKVYTQNETTDNVLLNQEKRISIEESGKKDKTEKYHIEILQKDKTVSISRERPNTLNLKKHSFASGGMTEEQQIERTQPTSMPMNNSKTTKKINITVLKKKNESDKDTSTLKKYFATESLSQTTPQFCDEEHRYEFANCPKVIKEVILEKLYDSKGNSRSERHDIISIKQSKIENLHCDPINSFQISSAKEAGLCEKAVEDRNERNSHQNEMRSTAFEERKRFPCVESKDKICTQREKSNVLQNQDKITSTKGCDKKDETEGLSKEMSTKEKIQSVFREKSDTFYFEEHLLESGGMTEEQRIKRAQITEAPINNAKINKKLILKVYKKKKESYNVKETLSSEKHIATQSLLAETTPHLSEEYISEFTKFSEIRNEEATLDKSHYSKEDSKAESFDIILKKQKEADSKNCSPINIIKLESLMPTVSEKDLEGQTETSSSQVSTITPTTFKEESFPYTQSDEKTFMQSEIPKKLFLSQEKTISMQKRDEKGKIKDCIVRISTTKNMSKTNLVALSPEEHLSALDGKNDEQQRMKSAQSTEKPISNSKRNRKINLTVIKKKRETKILPNNDMVKEILPSVKHVEKEHTEATTTVFCDKEICSEIEKSSELKSSELKNSKDPAIEKESIITEVNEESADAVVGNVSAFINKQNKAASKGDEDLSFSKNLKLPNVSSEHAGSKNIIEKLSHQNQKKLEVAEILVSINGNAKETLNSFQKESETKSILTSNVERKSVQLDYSEADIAVIHTQLKHGTEGIEIPKPTPITPKAQSNEKCAQSESAEVEIVRTETKQERPNSQKSPSDNIDNNDLSDKQLTKSDNANKAKLKEKRKNRKKLVKERRQDPSGKEVDKTSKECNKVSETAVKPIHTQLKHETEGIEIHKPTPTPPKAQSNEKCAQSESAEVEIVHTETKQERPNSQKSPHPSDNMDNNVLSDKQLTKSDNANKAKHKEERKNREKLVKEIRQDPSGKEVDKTSKECNKVSETAVKPSSKTELQKQNKVSKHKDFIHIEIQETKAHFSDLLQSASVSPDKKISDEKSYCAFPVDKSKEEQLKGNKKLKITKSNDKKMHTTELKEQCTDQSKNVQPSTGKFKSNTLSTREVKEKQNFADKPIDLDNIEKSKQNDIFGSKSAQHAEVNELLNDLTKNTQKDYESDNLKGTSIGILENRGNLFEDREEHDPKLKSVPEKKSKEKHPLQEQCHEPEVSKTHAAKQTIQNVSTKKTLTEKLNDFNFMKQQKPKSDHDIQVSVKSDDILSEENKINIDFSKENKAVKLKVTDDVSQIEWTRVTSRKTRKEENKHNFQNQTISQGQGLEKTKAHVEEKCKPIAREENKSCTHPDSRKMGKVITISNTRKDSGVTENKNSLANTKYGVMKCLETKVKIRQRNHLNEIKKKPKPQEDLTSGASIPASSTNRALSHDYDLDFPPLPNRFEIAAKKEKHSDVSVISENKRKKKVSDVACQVPEHNSSSCNFIIKETSGSKRSLKKSLVSLNTNSPNRISLTGEKKDSSGAKIQAALSVCDTAKSHAYSNKKSETITCTETQSVSVEASSDISETCKLIEKHLKEQLRLNTLSENKSQIIHHDLHCKVVERDSLIHQSSEKNQNYDTASELSISNTSSKIYQEDFQSPKEIEHCTSRSDESTESDSSDGVNIIINKQATNFDPCTTPAEEPFSIIEEEGYQQHIDHVQSIQQNLEPNLNQFGIFFTYSQNADVQNEISVLPENTTDHIRSQNVTVIPNQACLSSLPPMDILRTVPPPPLFHSQHTGFVPQNRTGLSEIETDEAMPVECQIHSFSPNQPVPYVPYNLEMNATAHLQSDGRQNERNQLQNSVAQQESTSESNTFPQIPNSEINRPIFVRIPYVHNNIPTQQQVVSGSEHQMQPINVFPYIPYFYNGYQYNIVPAGMTQNEMGAFQYSHPIPGGISGYSDESTIGEECNNLTSFSGQHTTASRECVNAQYYQNPAANYAGHPSFIYTTDCNTYNTNSENYQGDPYQEQTFLGLGPYNENILEHHQQNVLNPDQYFQNTALPEINPVTPSQELPYSSSPSISYSCANTFSKTASTDESFSTTPNQKTTNRKLNEHIRKGKEPHKSNTRSQRYIESRKLDFSDMDEEQSDTSGNYSETRKSEQQDDND